MSAADKTFRGTLLLLQNKTKRDPESYQDEFRTQLRHFQAVCKALLARGAGGTSATDAASVSSPQFLAVMQFVCHVAYCYPKECAELPNELIALLRHCKESLDAESRLAIVNGLLLLRNKNIASAETTLPVLFELLESRDKTLRRTILAHIVSDVRRINLPGAKEGSAHVNKQIQNFLFKVMEGDDAVQARSALSVTIDLYRRQLWCNEKTVQVITKAVFSRHTLILRMALHFFLMQMPKFSTVGSDSDEDDKLDPGRIISKLKHKLKHKGKTVKRERVLKYKVEKQKKRFDHDRNADLERDKQLPDPVRLLQDPLGFVERLLAKLQRTTERFEVRLLYMSVLARVISEHELVVLGVFPLLERYLEPTQLHATNILALASTCVHPMVPPDALESFVRTIADRFVNDRSDRDSITIGINTIREICKRQPLAMNKDLLADLVEYRQRRGERGVIMASRALLQLYREVNPELLAPKLRGARGGPALEVVGPRFGTKAPLKEIPGLEALFGEDGEGADGTDAENEEDADDTDSSHIEFSSDDESGEWEMVSNDSDEMFSDPDEDEDDAADEVPQLVPVKAKAAVAKAAAPTTKAIAASATAVAAAPRGERKAPRGRPSANGFVAEDDMWGDDDNGADADDEEAEDEETAEAAPPRKAHRVEQPAARRQPQQPQDESDGDSAEEEEASDEADDDEEVEFDDDEEGELEEGDDSDDEEGTSSGSGEWVDVPHSSDDEDNEAVAPAAKNGNGHSAKSKKGAAAAASAVVASAEAGDSDDDGAAWVEDASSKRSGSTAMLSGASSSGKQSVATMRTLTDEEFAKLRGDRTLGGKPMKTKALEKQARMSRKDSLVRDLGEKGQLIDPAHIETFTSKKRERDRERKVEEAKQKRFDASPFNLRKKKKTKLTTTHREKQKVGKLYQMTKRSQRVALKIKRSVEERRDHDKDMKKKNIKFRIARGWKA
jgi:protein SDA1